MKNLQTQRDYNQVKDIDPRNDRSYLLFETPVIFDGRIFSSWDDALKAKTGESLIAQ